MPTVIGYTKAKTDALLSDKQDEATLDADVAAKVSGTGPTRTALNAAIDGRAAPIDTFHSARYASLAALFTAADAAGNCVIKIAPGSYSTATTLRITKPNVTIHAEGATITLANGSNVNLLAFGPDAMNINIVGGRWDGNKTNNTSGHCVIFEEYTGGFRVADRSNLERCELLNAAQDALRFEPDRVEIKARRCQIRDAGRYGVYFGGTDCAFIDGAIGLCATAGVYNDDIGNWVIGNGIYTCGTGIRLTENSRASYTALNMIDVNTGHGMHIEGTSQARQMDAVIAGNTFLSNSQAGSGLYSDIFIQNASSVTLTGNVGSKKVGVTTFPAYAIQTGTGTGVIIDVGNYWEPTGYATGIYSTPAAVGSKVLRVDTSNAVGTDFSMNSRVGAESFDRFRVRADGTLQWGPGSGVTDVNLYRVGVDQLKTDDYMQAPRFQVYGTAGAGFLHFEGEQSSDPTAPSANGARLFTKDNGAGKTQLCVRFATGAVQVIATEP